MTDKKLASRTYTTKLPDKPGAFMLASKIIMKHGGNIVRVSYDKAVDLRTLFVEVSATQTELDNITKELEAISYLEGTEEPKKIVINIKIKDSPGGLYPVLKIFDRYDANLSYLNSKTDNGDYQNFKMGMVIENPEIVKHILDDIAEIYQLNVKSYNGNDPDLDNTVRYIRLANALQVMFNMSSESTMAFLQESGRISQALNDKGVSPVKLFDDIEKLATFISQHTEYRFNPEIAEYRLNDDMEMYAIQPPCGSNTYIIRSGNDVLFVDTGYGIFANEMTETLRSMFPSLFSMRKNIFVTHPDVDHCGLLSVMDDAKIHVTKNASEILARQMYGVSDVDDPYEEGFSRLSGIITDYVAPEPSRFTIYGGDDSAGLVKAGEFDFAGAKYEVYEANGGSIRGDAVLLCKELKMIFTGEILSGKHTDAGSKAVAEELKRLIDSIGGLKVCQAVGSVKE